MKILIVDDNKTFLNQMKKYLMIKNFDVDVVSRGKDALKMLGNEYDVVLVDLKMPDISGIEIMREAKRKAIKTKFVVITGYGEVESAVEAMKLGAVDYIQKPFDMNKLLEILSKIKEKRREHPFVDFLKGYINASTLLISECPEKFRDEYEIDVKEIIPLKEKMEMKEILSHVIEFAKKGKYVIHTGVKLLHEKGILERYLEKLQEVAEQNNLKIIFICQNVEEKRLLDKIYKGKIKNVEKIIEVCKNPVRRKILHFLHIHGNLKYGEIMKLLDMEYSSKLAFHLKKLKNMKLVKKKGNKYVLTPEGEYITKIFDMLIMERGKISYFVL